MFELNKIVRKNIRDLVPYSSARDEYKGAGGIFLDANENTCGSPVAGDYNRYPDPMQLLVKEKIASLKGVSAQNIFLGNGSDEAIDILFRVFCEPAKDNVIICPPTYGMYEVAANINDVEVRKVLLNAGDFQLDVAGILKGVDENTRLIFVCSPNNPTGNLMRPEDIRNLMKAFKGILVVDEAYIDFADAESFISLLNEYPNLVVLQTFSKAWGMAGLRVGMAFASEALIGLFNKVKAPYNVNVVSQQILLEALDRKEFVEDTVERVIRERKRITEGIRSFNLILSIYPSDSNFLLVQMSDARDVYEYLVANQVVVRDRSKVQLCDNCLRITIGTSEENDKLIQLLKEYEKVTFY